MQQRRRFIRHPAEIPLEVLDHGPLGRLLLSNVSEGGLCFLSGRPFALGAAVRLRIASVQPRFEAEARVTWCRAVEDGFEVGAQFLDDADAFRARMVEQVCHIERYRREVREREGRDLDGGAAAREWIDRYAAEFPDPARD
jgi:hypothetical protein